MTGPLHGNLIVVTRAAWAAHPLSKRLVELGARVSVIPAIAFGLPADGGAELREAVSHPEATDWVAFASAAAVTVFADAAEAAGTRERWRTRRFAAVGPSTASMVEQRFGVEVEVMPDRYNAAALAAAMGASTDRCLLPVAEHGRPDLEHGLLASGWAVSRVRAYRTREVTFDPDELRTLRTADAVTFASPSAVRSVTRAVDVEGVPVVIGPTTAAAAREAGLAPREAAEATEDGLVATLIRVIGR